MQRIKFDESDILDAFYAKAMADGMLDKPAENLYADFDIGAPVKNDLEDIVVVASHENQLYGLPGESGEEMVGKAHPGGGTTIDLDNNKPKGKDLAKFETVVELQKAMREVAEGKPTGKLAQAMVKLVALANLLDSHGERAQAAEIDVELAKLAADLDAGGEYAPGITMGDPTVTNAPASEQDAKLDASRRAWQDAKARADKAARLKDNNSRIISLLNQIRLSEGKSRLAASEPAGVMTKEVVGELRNTIGSDYKTWRDLFTKLEQRAAASSKPIQDVSRKGTESGAPASIPNLSADVPPVVLPSKGPPVAPRN